MRAHLLTTFSCLALVACAQNTDSQKDEPTQLVEGVDKLTKAGGGTNGDWDFCGSLDCVSGEGDCDGDAQCGGEADLLCGDNNGARFGLSANLDVCWPSHCESGVQDGDETGVDIGGSCDGCDGVNGDFDFCSAACACDAGEGDCDNDTHCTAGNLCGTDNGARFGASASLDFCWPEHCESGVQDGDETGIDLGGSCGGGCFEGAAGSFDYCSNACPCVSGGGDCDGDAQCSGDLVCGDNNGWRFGYSASVDICWPSTCSNAQRDKGETDVDIGGPCGAGPRLVINEFEYDDLSGDNMEFVEIYNAGTHTMSLANVILEAVDVNGDAYQTYNLVDAVSSLRPGEYLVVGAALVVSALPEGVSSIEVGTYVFNNVTAGFKLRDGSVLLDTVSYEGSIAGITETNPAQNDANLSQGNSRCANGVDTEDGASDFILANTTPGAANTCP